MVDLSKFSKLGVSEDTIREYESKYGDDAERMLEQHFGGNRSSQDERTSQQNQGMGMSDQNQAM